MALPAKYSIDKIHYIVARGVRPSDAAVRRSSLCTSSVRHTHHLCQTAERIIKPSWWL